MNTPSTERDLGRVEGKIDLVLQQFNAFGDRLDTRDRDSENRLADRIKDNEKRHKATEDRVGKLETRLLLLTGATLVTLGSYFGDGKHVLLTLLHMAAP